MTTLSLRYLLAFGAIFLCIPDWSSAADRTWTGAGADARWATANNWGDTAPSANDTLFFGGAARLANTNDFSADTAFAGLTFLPGASSFTLAGNRITLGGNIVNQSPATQNVDLPLLITGNASRYFNATNGPIAFSGTLSYDNRPTSTNWFKKTGTKELVLTGTTLVTNPCSRFALDEGTLRFAPGSRFHLVDFSNDRNIFRVGDVANKKAAMIVESGADVAIGGLNLQVSGVSGGTGTFDLNVNGNLLFTGSDNTFGDQPGNRVSCVIDNGGTLQTVSNAQFNVGTRIPMTMTLNNGSVWLGNLYTGRSSTGDRPGSFTLFINRGTFFVQNDFGWMNSTAAVRTNAVTLGNGTLGAATLSTLAMKQDSPTGTTILNLNGGILECRAASANFLSGLDQVNMLRGGVIIDTQGNDVTITETVRRDPSLSMDVRDGGLTKRGTGTLAFTGTTNQFNGRLRVENGSLRISANMLSAIEDLYLAPGKTLSFRGSYRQALAPEYLRLGDTSTVSRLDLDVAADGSACDTIRIPAGGHIGKLNINLFLRSGTETVFSRPGDYPIFTYETEPPDITLLTHANRDFGVTSSFRVDRANKAVILRLALSDTETTWSSTTGGAWETAANWNPASPSGTPEARARFWGAITTPATVTLGTDTRIGGISFKNANSYTLAGSGLLTLGDQTGGGYLTCDSGSHTVDLGLSLACPITMNVSPSQTLTLNGVIAGDGRIVKGNSGTLLLSNANTFAGGITVSAGTLSIPAASALGSGPLILAGGTARSTAASLTLDSRLRVQAGSTLDTGTTTVRVDGLLDWTGTGMLTKSGTGELILAGFCSENNTNVLFNFSQGTTRLVLGTAYHLRGGNRDILQATYNTAGQTSSLIIEPGATLNAGGMRLLAGGSAGTATVHVAGGALNLLDTECTIVNTSNGRGNILVDNGGSLYAATGWFCLGVHGLGTLTVSNGTASVAFLTMSGYGDTVGLGNRGGSAQVTVSSNGVFEIRDYLTWITDNMNQTAGIRADGGKLIIPATTRAVGSTGTARLVLNGGTLTCSGPAGYAAASAPTPSVANYLYGVDEFLIGANGATIDTGLNDITITQPLSMESGVTASGFTKAGAGRLTLSGANTFDAPVTVAAGTLALSTLPSNHVAIASGAKLAFSPNSATTELVASADFAAGSTLAVDYEMWNGLDSLSVSGSLSLHAPVNIDLDGVPDGTYTLFTYGSLTGSASSLRIANPLSYLTYTFTDTGSAIQLTVGRNSAYYWTVPSATSTWSVASHWSPEGIPNAPGDFAGFHFGSLAPAPFISLTSPITVGALSFDAERDVTLVGSALTLDSGTFSTPPQVQNNMSFNVIGSDLILNSDSLANITAGTSLTLAGDVSGLGSLAVEGGGTLVLTGTNTVARTKVTGGSTLTLGALSAQQTPLELDGATLSAAGSASSGADILFGAFGTTSAPATDATLTLSGTLSGEGGIVKSGSSRLALSGTLAYRGTTALTGGTLALATPPPAGLTLGAGTFAYTGADANLPGYTLNAGASPVAAVLDSDANLTVTGAVSSIAGGFVKRGSGTLTFVFPGSQQLGLANSSAAQDTLLNIGANGDAPTQGFNPFSVAEGSVVLGAPGQVNAFAGNLVVGHYTSSTAAGETAAHLAITGGTTTVAGNLAVGRGNGNTTTAPVPLESSVTIDAGTVNAASFSVGHNGGNTSGFNAHPAVTVNGGTVTASQINLAEHLGCVGAFTVNGGEVALTDLVRIGHQTSSGGGGTGTLTVNGGSLTVANDINLGVTASATGTLYLAGGLTAARNVIVGSGYGRILFDGGTLRLATGPMDKPQALLVMNGGAKIDIATGRFTLALPLLSGEAGDGGLTKTGAGILALDGSLSHTYTGPTVIEEGILSLRGAAAAPLPAGTTLTVNPGASFHTSSELGTAPRTVTVAGLALGTPDAAAGLALWLDSGNRCDQLAVAGAVTLGKAALTLYQSGTLDPALFNGIYPILTYAGTDPDISGLAVANPSATHGYTFSVDSGNKRVLLTLSDAAGASEAVWTRDGNGDWSAGGNWQSGSAPTALATPVRFANVLSQDRTVNVDAPAAVGGLTFDASNRYTVAGTETVTLSGDTAALTIQRGSHTVAAPLAVAAAGNVVLMPSGNTLTLAGPIAGSGAALSLASSGTVQFTNGVVDTAVTVNAGTLELQNGAEINGALRYNAGQIIATGGNPALDGVVELPPGNKSLRANSGATLTVNGPVVGQGTLFKDNGGGTLVLAAASTFSGGTRISNGTLALSGSGTPGSGAVILEGGTLASAGSAPVAFANTIGFTNSATVVANAPLATSGLMSMPGPRAITKEGSNTWSIGGSLDVGGSANYRLILRDGITRFAPGAYFRMTGAELLADQGSGDARAQILGGNVSNRAHGLTVEPDAEVILGSFGLQWDSTTTNSTFDLIMNGGSLVVLGNQPLCLGDASNLLIRVENNGGTLRTLRDDAWCDIGTRSKVWWTLNDGLVSLGRPAFGRMNGSGSGRLNGGTTMEINGGTFEARQFFSWKSTDDNSTTNTVTLGDGAASQARFSIPATKRYHNGGRVILNLNGGVLETRGLRVPLPDDGLNGSLADYLYGVNALNVLEGGAVIDTLTNAVTITQLFTAGAKGDGGITKLGPAKLTLNADVALTGRVTVAEGTLDANFTAAPDLTVLTNGVLDLSQASGAATFTAVSGSGRVTNGTLAVAGTLSPGTAAGEANTLRAEKLTFLSGSRIRYDWSASTNDLFAVSGLLTGASGGVIDFGREAGDAIPVPFTALLGTYGSFAGTFGGWKSINTGLPAHASLSTTLMAEDGKVTLKVAFGGLIILVR